MIVTLHKKENKTIVAVCDDKLINTEHKEGDKQLDLRREFYKGEQRTAEEVGDLIRNADVINLVGEQSTKIGLNEEVITKEQVQKIAGIPYAQTIVEDE